MTSKALLEFLNAENCHGAGKLPRRRKIAMVQENYNGIACVSFAKIYRPFACPASVNATSNDYRLFQDKNANFTS